MIITGGGRAAWKEGGRGNPMTFGHLEFESELLVLKPLVESVAKQVLEDYDRARVLLGPKELQLQQASTTHACLINYKTPPTGKHTTHIKTCLWHLLQCFS